MDRSFKSQWLLLGRALAVAMACGLSLITALALALDGQAGHQFLVAQIESLKPDTGLHIDMGQISGSLYGEMSLTQLSLSDSKGVFLTSPTIRLKWQALSLLSGKTHINNLAAPLITLYRAPELKAAKSDNTNSPQLSNIRLDLDRLQIDQIVIRPKALNETEDKGSQSLSLSANLHVDQGQAFSQLSLKGSEGDFIHLDMAIKPKANQLGLSADISGPQNGILAHFSHLDQNIDAHLSGNGNWQAWRGHIKAQIAKKTMIDAALAVDKGIGHVFGQVFPKTVIKSTLSEALLTPVNIDYTANMNRPLMPISAVISTQNLHFSAGGGLDLSQNRFDHLKLKAELVNAKGLYPDFEAQGLVFSDAINGPFSNLSNDYSLKARLLSLQGTAITQLNMTGHADITPVMMDMPFVISTGLITGPPQSYAALFSHLTIKSHIRLAPDSYQIDGFALKSDAIDFSLTSKGRPTDLSGKGQFTLNLKNYDLADLGHLRAQSEGNFELNKGRFAVLSGRIEAQASNLSNGPLATYFGQKLDINSALYTDLLGRIYLNSFNIVSEKLKLTAHGNMSPKGDLALTITADQSPYGRFQLLGDGNLDRPHLILTAPSPDLAMGVTDLRAEFKGHRNPDISAHSPYDFDTALLAQSKLGPMGLKAVIHLAKSASLDIEKLDIGGVRLKGGLNQDPNGLFTGTLGLASSDNTPSVSGRVDVSDQQGQESVRLTSQWHQAHLFGGTIGDGIISMSALFSQNLQASGHISLNQTQFPSVLLTTFKADGEYEAGIWHTQLSTSGRTTLPFDVSLSGQGQALGQGQQADIIAKGHINGMELAFKNPAHIEATASLVHLSPLSLTASCPLHSNRTCSQKGQVDIEGTFGSKTHISAIFNKLDLSLANFLAPELGVSGMGQGQIDMAQNGDETPTGRLDVTFDKLTRSSASSLSEPLQMHLVATLDGVSAQLSAVFRQNDQPIGRLQAHIIPLKGQSFDLSRYAKGQMSGGLRYKGDAEALFSLAGLSDQTLVGALGVAADFSGTAQSPHLTGVIKGLDLTYDHTDLGTHITHIGLDGQFSDDHLSLTRFEGKAGKGSFNMSGQISFSSAAHFPAQLSIGLNQAQLTRSDALSSTLSGTLSVSHGADGGLISGDLSLPQLNYVVTPSKALDVPVLIGVHPMIKGAENSLTNPDPFKLNIHLKADSHVFLSGMGLQSEWQSDVSLQGTSDTPKVTGEMRAIRGTYDFAGKSFTIDQGLISFDGGNYLDPNISLSASIALSDITGTINISGQALKPDISFSSNPSLPSDEVLARLLFGQSLTNLSATETLQLAATVNELRGGPNPMGRFQRMTGIDRLSVLSADQASGRGTAVQAGKYLTRDIYVEVITDAKGFTATQLDIALSRALTLLSQTGSSLGTSVNLRYSKDY